MASVHGKRILSAAWKVVDEGLAHRGQGIGGTDKAMTSGDVSAVVTGSARPPVGGGSSQKQA